MRWLLPGAAVAQALGIWLADREVVSAAAAGAIALVCFGAGLCLRRPVARAVFALVLAGSAGASGLASRLELARSAVPSGELEVTVEADVCAARTASTYVDMLLCDVQSAEFAASAVPRRVRVVEASESEEGRWIAGLSVRDRVRVRLALRPLRSLRNPGVRDAAVKLERQGIGARGQIVDAGLAVRLTRPANSDSDRGQGWRTTLVTQLVERGAGGALAAALALGDRSGLEESRRRAVNRLGLSHLLAVSGLHLALVAGFAYALARGALVRIRWIAEQWDARVIALAAALLAAMGYGTLTGWGLPVQRAAVFLLLAVAAVVAGRRRAAPQLLALAAIVVLCLEPAALFSLGPQLSFAASAALLFSRSPEWLGAPRSMLHAVAQHLRDGLRTTASVLAATAPVLAFHGVAAGFAAFAANLVAVPWTAFALLPSSLLATALIANDDRGSRWLADLALLVCRESLGVAEEIAARLAPLPAAAPLGFAGLVVAVAFAIAAVRSGGTLARLSWALLAILWLRIAPAPDIDPLAPRVVVFDVAQGDATLVQGHSAAILVDGGAAWEGGYDYGARVVVPGLRALGVQRLAVVAASHGDLDHRGGLAAVLSAFEVDALWLPSGGASDPRLAQLIALARERGTAVLERSSAHRTQRIGDLEISVLWPRARDPARRGPQAANPSSSSFAKAERLDAIVDNDTSLVIAVAIAGERVLLTGDISSRVEAELIASGQPLRASILKLAHHGSRSSSSATFLAAVAPRLAIVSAGCPRPRRLPHVEVLERVRDAGAETGWTGRDGALIVGLGPDWRVRRWGVRDRGCSGHSAGLPKPR